MSKIDEILGIIDGHTQRTSEPAYDEDSDPTSCVRCSRPKADGEFCADCRAFVLGDTDVDPCGDFIFINAFAHASLLGIMSADDARRALGFDRPVPLPPNERYVAGCDFGADDYYTVIMRMEDHPRGGALFTLVGWDECNLLPDGTFEERSWRADPPSP